MIVYSVSRHNIKPLSNFSICLIFPVLHVLVTVMMNSTFLPLLYRHALATQHKIYLRVVMWEQSILSSDMQMFWIMGQYSLQMHIAKLAYWKVQMVVNGYGGAVVGIMLLLTWNNHWPVIHVGYYCPHNYCWMAPLYSKPHFHGWQWNSSLTFHWFRIWRGRILIQWIEYVLNQLKQWVHILDAPQRVIRKQCVAMVGVSNAILQNIIVGLVRIEA